MSAELIGILSVGVALGGLLIALQARTDKRLDGFEKRLDGFEKRLDGFGQELAGLRVELRALGERVARLEGLIEGSGLFRRAELSEASPKQRETRPRVL